MSTILNYCASGAVVCGGLVYALVPLYKLYCQSIGFSGSQITQSVPSIDKKETKNRMIKVIFEANIDKKLGWSFKPLQKHMNVQIGTGTLAFYNAHNYFNEECSGIATYNIIPQRAAIYFNKIQCFCFEEQTLGSGENVDMPVYFYLDPDFINDKHLDNVQEIVLSYTFFNSNSNKNV